MELPNKPVFFDVGANIGTHSLRAARAGYQVHAFEPDPLTAKYLHLNSNLNGLGITVNNFAVGDIDGYIDLIVNVESSGLSKTSLDVQDNIAQNGAEKRLQVKLNTLDNYVRNKEIQICNRQIVVKIDVEGSEASVLQGMSELINSADDILLIIEAHSNNLDLFTCLNEIVSKYSTDRAIRMKLLRFGKPAIDLDVNKIVPAMIEGGGDIYFLMTR